MLHTMREQYDDVRDRMVADFGCGTGMLSIGLAVAGARCERVHCRPN